MLFRDVRQSCSRMRAPTFGSDGQHLSFTVTPGQVTVVFQEAEKPRLLLGEEAMVLQGFPIAKVSDLVDRTSNHVMADLAGNMVAVPVLLALMMAAVACVRLMAVTQYPIRTTCKHPYSRQSEDSFLILCNLMGKQYPIDSTNR